MYRRQPLKFILKTCNSRFPVDIPLYQWRFSKALVGFLGVLCFLFTHDGACISRQLPTHELSIDTSIRHQFIMGALLHNEALVNYTNLGGVDDGTQTVSNQNHCTWWLKMVVSSKMDREVPPPTWVIKCPHFSHHPTIRYMVYNGYYKVMSNIPKMGHLPTPAQKKGYTWCGFPNRYAFRKSDRMFFNVFYTTLDHNVCIIWGNNFGMGKHVLESPSTRK